MKRFNADLQAGLAGLHGQLVGLGDSWRDLGERDRALAAYDRSFKVIGFSPRPTAVRMPQGAFSTAN